MDHILDILLDPENDADITLFNEAGEETVFEQVAVIPYPTDTPDTLYAILKPLVPFDGMDDETVIVFRVDEGEDEEDVAIVVETDEDVAAAVFAEFERLVDEAFADEE